jgi:hypothetical protein
MAGVATYNPKSVIFPLRKAGTASRSKMIVVGNSADNKSQLVIGSTIVIGSNFVIDSANTTCTTGASLKPGSKCHVGLSFTPSSAGRLAATLMITDNSSNGPHLVMAHGTSD